VNCTRPSCASPVSVASCWRSAEQIAAECGVTLPDIGTATAFTNKVRNALARRQDGLAWERESITGTVLWHVAEDANGLPDTRQKVSAP
jgi:hypothetical protein